MTQQAAGSGGSSAGFQETPYADSSWEIVGPPPGNGTFEAMQLENLNTTTRVVDPMFADFGGRGTEGKAVRWHLPENQTGSQRPAPRPDEPKVVGVPEAEVVRRIAEATAAARSAGLAEGRAEVAETNSKATERLTTWCKDLESQLLANSATLEAAALQIAVEISHKILFATAEVNPEYIVPIIREGLRLTQGARIHKVRVSPQDLEFVELEGVAKKLSEFDGSWSFVADETVKAGCIVETSAGEVDLDLEAAWQRVAQQVLRSGT